MLNSSPCSKNSFAVFLNGRVFFLYPGDTIRSHSKRAFVGEGTGGGGVIEKQAKTIRGRVVLACVYVRCFKKNAEVFKMKSYSYSPVFPTDHNVSMKY